MWKFLLVTIVLLVGWVFVFRPSFLFSATPSTGESDVDKAVRTAGREPSNEQTTSLQKAAESPPTNDGGAVPLFENAVWRYRVRDSRQRDAQKEWSMRVVRVPKSGAAGLMESGFEGSLSSSLLADDDGDIRMDGLDFVAPSQFQDSQPLRIEGETLPRTVRLVEGAVWEFRIELEPSYRFTDKKGKVTEATVHAEEHHRAYAKMMETIQVPKGRFSARRIEWVSRVQMTADGRPVLCPLTAEPYRKETMWVAPNVGIIKRQITFLSEAGADTVVVELTDGPGR
jgi:hypothetical protein